MDRRWPGAIKLMGTYTPPRRRKVRSTPFPSVAKTPSAPLRLLPKSHPLRWAAILLFCALKNQTETQQSGFGLERRDNAAVRAMPGRVWRLSRRGVPWPARCGQDPSGLDSGPCGRPVSFLYLLRELPGGMRKRPPSLPPTRPSPSGTRSLPTSPSPPPSWIVSCITAPSLTSRASLTA